MNIVALAGSLPRDPQFREFVAHRMDVDDISQEDAADFIRVMCGVKSRRELESNATAEAYFFFTGL